MPSWAVCQQFIVFGYDVDNAYAFAQTGIITNSFGSFVSFRICQFCVQMAETNTLLFYLYFFESSVGLKIEII